MAAHHYLGQRTLLADFLGPAAGLSWLPLPWRFFLDLLAGPEVLMVQVVMFPRSPCPATKSGTLSVGIWITRLFLVPKVSSDITSSGQFISNFPGGG